MGSKKQGSFLKQLDSTRNNRDRAHAESNGASKYDQINSVENDNSSRDKSNDSQGSFKGSRQGDSPLRGAGEVVYLTENKKIGIKFAYS